MIKAYQLKVAVKNAKPPVWCRCIIPAGITFSQLSLLLAEITGEQDEIAFEFEFYHRKVRVWEAKRVTFPRTDFYYDLRCAYETFINDLLDTEEWFSFYCSSDKSYRITIENILDDYPHTYAIVDKYKGDWQSDSFRAPRDVDSVNEILKEKYEIAYGRADLRTRIEVENDIITGKYGLKGSNRAISKTEHYKQSANSLIQEFTDQLGGNTLSNKADIIKKESLKNYLTSYTKEELKCYAQDLDMQHYSSLKKHDLAEKIADYILIPSVMRRRMSLLTDEQVAAFEKAIGSGVRYTPKEDEVDQFNAIYSLDYIIMYKDDSLCVPDEVIAAYEKINTPEFHDQRKKIQWMQACLEMHAIIYAAAPIEIMHRMYRRRPGYKVNREEWLEIYNLIPNKDNPSIIIDDKVILKEVLVNDIYLKIEEAQGLIDFYIPNYKEILDCMENKYPSKEPAYQDLKRFLRIVMQMEELETIVLTNMIWNQISFGCDFDDIMDMFNDLDIDFPNKKSFKRFSAIIQNANYHTRLLIYRGNKPVEMFEKDNIDPMKTGELSAIVPMNSMVADMLGSSQNELEERGFSIDFDSNAQETPVALMKKGSNGIMEMGSKKIYPNDPCPCGSGKKYKKCCGNNRK